ncbi:MAG: hypothetical protein U9O98_06585 [Asgard group archaeon]|nr:hypothetical protein [Asgard group archaeon]
MSNETEQQAPIVKFPGIASISLSIQPVKDLHDLDKLEAVVKVFDENDEQIMRQKARSFQTIAKNLKLFIQTRTNLPINDRRMAVWISDYLSNQGIAIEEEEAYQIIKEASEKLARVSRAKIELVEPTDLVSVETDVLAKIHELKIDHLLSEIELFDFLEKYQTPMSSEVKRTIIYSNSGGVEHKDTITLSIEPTKDFLTHSLTTTFKNESQNPLSSVKLIDIIPYNNKILSKETTELNKVSQELTADGLQVTWEIESVKPGKAVTTTYTFEPRIPRTIWIRKDEDVRIVQDYNSLRQETTEETGEIKQQFFISEVMNLLPVTLDEMIIRDLIPPDIQITNENLEDEVTIIDFGQKLGRNLQRTEMNVETGIKLTKKYFIEPAPLLWKFDVNVPLENQQGEINVTKIIEELPKKGYFVCSLYGTSPIPCLLKNKTTTGLTPQEFYPPEKGPTNPEDEQQWTIEGEFEVSMILKGAITTKPVPPIVEINGEEKTISLPSGKLIRKSTLLSVPFNHVALYRRQIREFRE